MADLNELIRLVKAFCSDRDWDQFHNPKDLAIGISTEAGELLDLFRFKTEAEIISKFEDHFFKEKVEDEIAYILFFILRFSQMNNIDLSKALIHKISKNEAKYPAEKSKGSNKKYNE